MNHRMGYRWVYGGQMSHKWITYELHNVPWFICDEYEFKYKFEWGFKYNQVYEYKGEYELTDESKWK